MRKKLLLAAAALTAAGVITALIFVACTSSYEMTGSYTVTFKVEDKAAAYITPPAARKVAKGGKTTLPTPGNFSRKDAAADTVIYYNFSGWFTESGIRVGGAAETYFPTASITLIGRWKESDEGNYSIYLYKQGGSGGADSVEALGGELPSLYTNQLPQRTGCLFRGYFEGPDGLGLQYYDEDGEPVAMWNKMQNGILYACWAGEDGETLASIDLSHPPITSVDGDRWEYTFENDMCHVYTIKKGPVTVTGSAMDDRIEVVNRTGESAIEITFEGVELSWMGGSPLTLKSGVNATLLLSGVNILTALGEGAAGIHVPPGTSLIIDSAGTSGSTSGSLRATGDSDERLGAGAGIGGNMWESSGTITIKGGEVTAIGGYANDSYAAGIGSGGGGASSGNIRIDGGKGTATGGQGGPGVGPGDRGGSNTFNGGFYFPAEASYVWSGAASRPTMTVYFVVEIAFNFERDIDDDGKADVPELNSTPAPLTVAADTNASIVLPQVQTGWRVERKTSKPDFIPQEYWDKFWPFDDSGQYNYSPILEDFDWQLAEHGEERVTVGSSGGSYRPLTTVVTLYAKRR